MENKLKLLQSQKTKLDQSLNQINFEIKELQDGKQIILKKIESVFKKISNLTVKKIIVSEHAILRFMERQMLVDIKKIKQKILPEKDIATIKSLGDGIYPVGCHKIIIKNGVVVTVK